jgi:glycosyltransferase involved in cell wall biosynthesis
VAVYAYAGGGVRADELAEAGIPTFVGESAWEDALAWGATLLHIHREGPTDAESGRLLRRFAAAPTPPRVIETNVFGRVDTSPDRTLIDVHLHLSAWCLWRWRRWARGLLEQPLGAVVPYAVDTDRFSRSSEEQRQSFRQSLGVPPGAVLFGRIGQPSEWKWHHSLFTAFGRVASARPEAYLFVVGLPDELRPALEGLPPDVARRVVEVPFLHGDDALRTAYSAMDAFVHAAEIGETFGMVLAESMLCETPVVTLSRPARDNSQLEVVGHEVGGLIAAGPRGLAEGMERLAADPDLRARLGRQGAARVRQRFALPGVMAPLLRIAEQAVEAPSRETLRAWLASAPDITTEVPDAEIEALLEGQIGRLTLVERAQRALIHRPEIHGLWTRLKQKKG